MSRNMEPLKLFVPLKILEPPTNPTEAISRDLSQYTCAIINNSHWTTPRPIRLGFRFIEDRNIQIDNYRKRAIINNMPNFIINELTKVLENKTSDNIGNFEFLARLGLKRDWKSGCVICQTEDIKGTICTCGHTEITIFRPCGHSICTRPCWVDFINHNGQYPGKQLVEINGIFYYEDNEVNPCTFKFYCPVCRSEVVSTFSNSWMNDSTTLLDYDTMAQTLLDTY